MSKRQLGPGERPCAGPGCKAVLPAPTTPGRPPTRCSTCRSQRRHRKQPVQPVERPRLTVVPPQLEPPAPVEPAPEPAAAQRSPESLADVARRELEGLCSTHPAVETLTATVVWLAEIAESPVIRVVEPTAAPAFAKAIRDTVQVLVEHEEADDDDIFAGLSSPLVNPSAG